MEGTRRSARRKDDSKAQQVGRKGKRTNHHHSTNKLKNKRRMPPIFIGYVQWLFDANRADEFLQDPEGVKYLLDYYRNLHHEDSRSITVAKGGKNSFLEKLLVRQALRRMRGKNETESSGWKLSNSALGAGSYGAVTLWQKDLPHERNVKLATKDHTSYIPFHRDYNNEGNAVRRLNDAGCKNVIEILDWVKIEAAKFRQIFEFAEFGDFHSFYGFYREHGLVLPEAFAWHFFYSIANALCYCRYGTNEPKFGLLAQRGWHQLYHQDMKMDNVLMTAIDYECHRLYPCHKLADFGERPLHYTLDLRAGLIISTGLACSIGKIEVDTNKVERNPIQTFKTAFRWGAAINKPPESRNPTAIRGPFRYMPIDMLQGSHSDIYSLGMMMTDLCKPADTYINNHKRFQDASVPNNFRTKMLSAYYSKPLKDLIRRCRVKVGQKRPDAYELYKETKEKMEHYRAKAYTAEVESRGDRKRYPGYLYHEKVLFTKADQALFEENIDFRGAFLDVNLGPVREAEGKFDMTGLSDFNDQDISFETDHISSTSKRRTAPEARVRPEIEGRLINSRKWMDFIQQTMHPAEAELAVDQASEYYY